MKAGFYCIDYCVADGAFIDVELSSVQGKAGVIDQGGNR